MTITFKVSTTPTPIKDERPPFVLNSILPGGQSRSPFSSMKTNENSSDKSPYSLIKCSEDQGTVASGGNSFVRTALTCYSRHHNLSLKPDDVWLAICTQFSNYVNGHSEQLRHRFVDFEGKKQLSVYVDGVNLHTADYRDICKQFTHQIADKIKDPSIREWVMPSFSTTTENERMVAAVMLMSVTKSYFDYKVYMLCGLPNVTLLGEVRDWETIRERATKLLEFDLEQKYMTGWTKVLIPVLDQFVESAKGNPDLRWWNRIVNYHGGGSGPSYLSGWITTFCVFNDRGQWQGTNKVETDFGAEESDWPIVDTDNIPRGYVNVPIAVNDNGIEYKTEMFAGHMSALKSEDGMTLSPSVGWALFDVTEK